MSVFKITETLKTVKRYTFIYTKGGDAKKYSRVLSTSLPIFCKDLIFVRRRKSFLSYWLQLII